MGQITPVPLVGLLIPGHDLTPAAAVEAAVARLTAVGADEWDIAAARPDMRPVRAWWGGPDVGFVGADHPDADPVIVIHLPDSLIPIPEE